MRLFPTALALTLALGLAGPCTAAGRPDRIKRLDGSSITTSDIESRVVELMREARVTGLNVAILNDSKVVYVKSFGWADKERRRPMTENTVVYGASFTKAAFAVLVMQLVQEGAFDLDKPVYLYFDKPLPEYEKFADLAGDERYKLITGRMLLSHTSGFPNFRWINDDKKLDIKFAPGSKYSYSGEGINLLQLAVEAATKTSVGVLMQRRVFDPLGMTRTSMTWETRFEDDYAMGYDADEKLLGHDKRENVRAAGSMDTTISDYAKFVEGVMRGKLLEPKFREEMVTPQIQIYSKHQFPTPSSETTEENRAIRLSYGLGWGVFFTPYGKAFFKEGHDDGWENHAVCFPEKKLALVLMTNSSNGDRIFKALLETIVGDRSTPWQWEGYVPYEAPPASTVRPRP